jgi:bifunctional DNA-binding transcriptional regulator/antitoxin component of YhaV-PrlF toxin-antitoxin module
VLPVPLRRKLGIRAGDPLDIAIEKDRIVLTQASKPKYEARIVKNPVTGFIALDLGPDAPILTSEMVREMLADFP